MHAWDCRHYGECLNRHARVNGDFSCDDCPGCQSEPCHPDPAELAGCLALLIAIFHPDEYRILSQPPGAKVCLLRAWFDRVAEDYGRDPTAYRISVNGPEAT